MHQTPHAQCSDQLVSRSTSAVNGDLLQTVVALGEGHVLRCSEPVAEKVLPHGQSQTANHDHAQPPVIEDHRARDQLLVITVNVNHATKDQRRHRDGLDDGNQRIIAEIAHHCAVHAEPDEQRDSRNRRTDEQPGVLLERIDQLIDTQSYDKRHPQSQPDQNNVGSNLNYSFFAAW